MKIDGYWLPKAILRQLISDQTNFSSLSYLAGRPSLQDEKGAITAIWPQFNLEEWQELLRQLKANQSRVPTGQAFWDRFQVAMNSCDLQLADYSNPLRIRVFNSLPGYTGYSESMINATLGAMGMMSLDSIPKMLKSSPSIACAREWRSMNELPGKIRFFTKDLSVRARSHLPASAMQPVYQNERILHQVVGFGAGNVPGTGLLIAILSLACSMIGEPAPVVLIRNSRQEPIFTPIVLEAIEQADPDLVSSLAVLVWDYEDQELQELLLEQTDLVIAAASDVTISQINDQIQLSGRNHRVRLHPHGHKVSFAVIGREMFDQGNSGYHNNQELIDMISFLAALDSVFWDQYGCLSARVHFVENGGNESIFSLEYASRLEKHLRSLSNYLPRGSWPDQLIHNRFDRYKQLETTGKVRVFSRYDDEFLLVHDEREINPPEFINQVNECQSRVIIIRPVNHLKDIPQRYLRWIPSTQLQSLSVAIGTPGLDLDAKFLRFAEECGACGVTAIRTVGRGAFPQLAYSWDGLLPLDLVCTRPAGYFTTIEFDKPVDQILETYRLMLNRGLQPQHSFD